MKRKKMVNQRMMTLIRNLANPELNIFGYNKHAFILTNLALLILLHVLVQLFYCLLCQIYVLKKTVIKWGVTAFMIKLQ